MAQASKSDLVGASAERLQPLPTGNLEGWSDETEREWLEVMMEKADRVTGDPGVQFAVGQYYFARQDYAKALKYYEKAAGQSNLQAKYQLGVMYFDGLGVEEDPAQGAEFMLQVAGSSDKKGSHIIPSAQYNMGRAFFNGFGVAQSDSDAEKWWTAAASSGRDPSALRASHTLGLFYSRPETRKLSESFKWHEEAAKSGNLESMAAMGVMLIQGQGCDKNVPKGLDWLKKSAQGGSVYGEGLLSRQYLGMKLYSKAVEAAFKVSDIDEPGPEAAATTVGPSSFSRLECIGVATACFVMGRCLQLGNAVTKDPAKAITYFEKAKRFDLGVTTELHNQMTHDQI